MSDRKLADQPRGKLWFNWPLVLGLIVNFAILAGLAFWILQRR
jgi:hypothetical protein